MRKVSVLIPDGDDDRALIVVRSLAYSKQVEIHVLSPKNRNVFFSRHCKAHELLSDNDTSKIRFDRVKEISEKNSIEVLLPIGEIGIRFVQKYRDHLNDMFRIPPVPGVNVLNTVSDKWLLNEFLRKKSYPFVKSIPLKDKLNGETSDTLFPVLLKPRIGAGGIGIHYVESRDVLLKKLESSGLRSGYIIQEYMQGTNIDLSVLCSNGEILAYTIQKPLFRVKNSFEFSKSIEFINNTKLLNFGTEILSDLKWSGIAHIDFIYNEKKDQFFLIDFNPRYWGTLTGSVLAGVNFPFLACRLALDESFTRPEYRESKYAIIKQKDLLHWILKKKNFSSIPFSSTNLKFVLKDPLPSLRV